MNNTVEDYIGLQVNAGAATNRATQTLQPGKIIGVMAYNNGAANAGYVRGRILDKSGAEICKLQDIRNFRSREAAYHDSYKPIIANGGENITVEVVATANFAANYLVDFIFVYEPQTNC